MRILLAGKMISSLFLVRGGSALEALTRARGNVCQDKLPSQSIVEVESGFMEHVESLLWVLHS